MDLTLFTIPKPFCGHAGIIQTNAIRSWTLLEPAPQIILLGEEEGTRQAAQQFGLLHSPHVARNKFGTPLLDSLFDEAQRLADHEWLCFVNADIILLADFLPAVERVRRGTDGSLMIGRRWDLDVTGHMAFEAGWENKLRAEVARRGKLLPAWGSDYFVFPKGLWQSIPPFAIGRLAYDNWLFFGALRSGAPLVDATTAVMAVHQNHDYGRLGSRLDIRRSPEARRNFELSRRDNGCPYVFSIKDATHALSPAALRRRRTHILRKWLWKSSRYWPVNRLYGLYMGLKGILRLTYAWQR
jgi:hypothetical protein